MKFLTICNLIGVVALSLSLASSYASADIIFSDGTFNSVDWNLTQIEFGDGGSTTVSQPSSGGNPDFYRRVINTINPTGSGNENAQIYAYSEYVAGSYTPSGSGAIDSIDFSIDTRFISGNAGALGGSLFTALRQDDKIYADFINVMPDTAWTMRSVSSSVANDFAELSMTGSSPVLLAGNHPDFTSSGTELRFGFVNSNSTGGSTGTLSNTLGFDNWNVTVHTVPEPSPLLLMVPMVLVCLAYTIVRHRRKCAVSVPHEFQP